MRFLSLFVYARVCELKHLFFDGCKARFKDNWPVSPGEGGRDYIHLQMLQSGKSGGRCSLFSAPREVLQHWCHAEDRSFGEVKAVRKLWWSLFQERKR